MGSPPASFDKQTPPQGDSNDPRLDGVLGLVPALKVMIGLAIAGLLIAALYFGRDLLIPIALAGFLAFLLDPAVSRLKRWGLPRGLAVGLVAVVALGVLAGAGTYLTYQLRDLSQSLPQYQDTIRGKVKDLREELRGPSAWDGAFSTIDTVQTQISQTVGKPKTSEQVQRVVIEETGSGPMEVMSAWLERIGRPVATAAIVALFVILILLDRDGLRDRALRLTGGGNLHMATDALQEATDRIGRYLRMQVLINACYGVPLAIGLWWIGVPAAPLWGVLAVAMRFIPYIGPMISAVFPLLLAFAVDPGWDMVLWTAGLIVVLELIINNVIEPWLYGASTGLSTLSLIIAATFWTALWGPIGLVLSTPLTVCLLVLGRYIPSLRFLEALLGNVDVLDPAQKLYQRLLADDVEEAVEMATDRVDAACKANDEDDDGLVTADAVLDFYDQVALPTLRLASSQHLSNATAQHRLRFANGMDALIKEMQEEYPTPQPSSSDAHVYVVGARWEVDTQAAQMTAHALRLHGINATALNQPLTISVPTEALQALKPGDVVCISSFHPQPKAILRQTARRLYRLMPSARLIAGTWAKSGSPLDDEADRDEGLLELPDLHGVLLFAQTELNHAKSVANDLDEDTAGQLATALRRSGVRDSQQRDLLDSALRQATNAFDVRYAQIKWFDGDQAVIAASLIPKLSGTTVPLQESACIHVLNEDDTLVITDTHRDLRMARVTGFREHSIAFYAGTPLRDAEGNIIGCLSILDTSPKSMNQTEIELFEKMASNLMRGLAAASAKPTAN